MKRQHIIMAMLTTAGLAGCSQESSDTDASRRAQSAVRVQAAPATGGAAPTTVPQLLTQDTSVSPEAVARVEGTATTATIDASGNQAEVPQWISDAGAVNDRLAEMAALLGPSFAGSWIDGAGVGHLAGVDQTIGDAVLDQFGASGAVQFHHVTLTWDQLVAEQRALEATWLADTSAAADAKPFSNLTIYADAASNSVVVECVVRPDMDCSAATRYAAMSGAGRLVMVKDPEA